MTQPTAIYKKVIKVSYIYLGPAAERFIDRQVENHLNKPAETMTANDLRSLIDWIHLAVSFLSKDSALVDEYVNSLRDLVAKYRE